VRNNFSVLNIYKKKNLKSEIVTQILYGDTFKILEKSNSWIKIKNDIDNYKGYIKNKKYPHNHKNTHKVFTLSANLYSKPKNSAKTKKKLSFSSKVSVTRKKNGFYKFDGFWIKQNTLKKIHYKNKNFFFGIKNFINIKYKWGGKHCSGVDCSGLIQLFFNYNNKFCPRDAKDQIRYFKKKVSLKNIKKNDLIFWKGHVALVISKNKLLHAYGPLKKVVIMPIKKTIDIILKTANLRVIGIRRP
jgi:gamma-D-glutamyl-L-lysine dipeptidyl-peptidase